MAKAKFYSASSALPADWNRNYKFFCSSTKRCRQKILYFLFLAHFLGFQWSKNGLSWLQPWQRNPFCFHRLLRRKCIVQPRKRKEAYPIPSVQQTKRTPSTKKHRFKLTATKKKVVIFRAAGFEYTCLGIPFVSATIITIRLPNAIVNSQVACITDCMLAGACLTHHLT